MHLLKTLGSLSRPLGITGISLALGGCFMSQQPLIAVGTGDAPFSDGGHFTEYLNCASQAGQLLGCSGYQAKGSGIFTLKDHVYRLRPDPGTPGLPPEAPAAGDDMPVSLKHVVDDLYVAQVPLGPASTDSMGNYLYEIVRIQGATAYYYLILCEQNGDQKYVASGLLKGISTQLLPICQVDNLDNLGKIFKERIANGAVPDSKIEFDH